MVKNELLGKLQDQVTVEERSHSASLEEKSEALNKLQAEMDSLRAQLKVR